MVGGEGGDRTGYILLILLTSGLAVVVIQFVISKIYRALHIEQSQTPAWPAVQLILSLTCPAYWPANTNSQRALIRAHIQLGTTLPLIT